MKERLGLDDVKMVLITNASMFHRPHVRRGLAILDAHQGEIWAKLEAGTDAYYQLDRADADPFRQILDNITGRGPGAAAGDPVAVHACRGRAALAPTSWPRFAIG